MSVKTLLFILAGTLAMWGVMLLCRKVFNLSVLKSLALSALLTVSGVLSVEIMFYIENGKWNGISFFGAIFFVPLFLIPAAYFTKTDYLSYLDLSAPCISIMLAFMKVNCLITGCCRGRVLSVDKSGIEVRFPSQLSEMIIAVLITVALILFIITNMLQHKIYPLFMVLYGVTRFALNLFRETISFWGEMGIGNMWAVISVAVGLLWLISAYILQERHNRNSSLS